MQEEPHQTTQGISESYLARDESARKAMRPPTLAELRAMSDEEIVSRYDALAKSESFYMDFPDYQAELDRREANRSNVRAEAATEEARRLTRVVTGLTAVAALAAMLQLVLSIF